MSALDYYGVGGCYELRNNELVRMWKGLPIELMSCRTVQGRYCKFFERALIVAYKIRPRSSCLSYIVLDVCIGIHQVVGYQMSCCNDVHVILN